MTTWLAPIYSPIRAQAADYMPKGIINMMAITEKIIVFTAWSFTLINPDKIPMTSKQKFSAQSMTMAGIPIAKYEYQPVKISMVGQKSAGLISSIK